MKDEVDFQVTPFLIHHVFLALSQTRSSADFELPMYRRSFHFSFHLGDSGSRFLSDPATHAYAFLQARHVGFVVQFPSSRTCKVRPHGGRWLHGDTRLPL